MKTRKPSHGAGEPRFRKYPLTSGVKTPRRDYHRPERVPKNWQLEQKPIVDACSSVTVAQLEAAFAAIDNLRQKHE